MNPLRDRKEEGERKGRIERKRRVGKEIGRVREKEKRDGKEGGMLDKRTREMRRRMGGLKFELCEDESVTRGEGTSGKSARVRGGEGEKDRRGREGTRGLERE